MEAPRLSQISFFLKSAAPGIGLAAVAVVAAIGQCGAYCGISPTKERKQEKDAVSAQTTAAPSLPPRPLATIRQKQEQEARQ